MYLEVGLDLEEEKECNSDSKNNIRTKFGHKRGIVRVLHRLEAGI